MLYAKSCPRCGGTVEYSQWEYGPEMACLMCGASWARPPMKRLRGAAAWSINDQEDGCYVAPKCLECPLATCVLDIPDGGFDYGTRLAKRAVEIVALRKEGVAIREIAEKYDLTERSIQRVLLRERQMAGVG